MAANSSQNYRKFQNKTAEKIFILSLFSVNIDRRGQEPKINENLAEDKKHDNAISKNHRNY